MSRTKFKTYLILLFFFEGDIDAIYEWLQDHFIYVDYEELEFDLIWISLLMRGSTSNRNR